LTDPVVTLGTPLRLPCGVTLSNRIGKAAMTEGLASPRLQPTERHERLYETWSDGGAAVHVTGNVMVDRRCLERPGNVAIEPDDPHLDRAAFERWAAAGTRAGNQLWMQLSHAGRQTPRYVTAHGLAPSDSSLAIPGGMFGSARALVESEIPNIIERFANASRVALETGFTGVEIHAAHGYLISEFLSPRVNRRTDRWGGTLENRARLLLEVVRAVRARVGPSFPVAVKLNSADFQRGGFEHEDCLRVVEWLGQEGIDLLEISGGTYEQPQMFAREGIEPRFDKRESTRAREAYFLEYAESVHGVTTLPLMVTGGFRSRAAMDAALSAGTVDVIGIARPLCVETDLPRRLLDGVAASGTRFEDGLRMGPGLFSENSPITLLRAINVLGAQAWFCLQLLRLGDGLLPDTSIGTLGAFLRYEHNELKTARALHRAR
jgi:2,4-dienoyl-CoA reductase-like NADH-dependent reductase (Old Yellow Enzyme family)